MPSHCSIEDDDPSEGGSAPHTLVGAEPVGGPVDPATVEAADSPAIDEAAALLEKVERLEITPEMLLNYRGNLGFADFEGEMVTHHALEESSIGYRVRITSVRHRHSGFWGSKPDTFTYDLFHERERNAAFGKTPTSPLETDRKWNKIEHHEITPEVYNAWFDVWETVKQRVLDSHKRSIIKTLTTKKDDDNTPG
jgi:hypothetical protein